MSNSCAWIARVAALGPAAFALVAASPAPNGFLGAPVFAEATIGSRPVAPQTPVVATGSGFTPAPMPDFEEAAPVQRTLGPAQPEVSAKIYQPQSTYRGEGYVYGSSVQASQTRNMKPAPGVSLKMPLE